MQNGAEQAAKDMGVDVKFHGPDQFSIPDIQKIFEASIALNPHGIAATLPDADALGPLVKNAVDQGIPTVLFNAGIDDWEKLGALTYVGQTEKEAGVAAGKRMAEAGVKYGLCINQLQGQQVLEERYQGFGEGLGGNVKEIAVEGSDPIASRDGIKSALQQNPDADGLLTLGPDVSEQALRAVEDTGKRDTVKVATFDVSPAVLKAVQDGDLLFAIDQQMFLQTYLSVLALINYIQYRVTPVGAVTSGPNFVTGENAQEILELSDKGFH
jgi:simple sugar transport system substrate-binding protein